MRGAGRYDAEARTGGGLRRGDSHTHRATYIYVTKQGSDPKVKVSSHVTDFSRVPVMFPLYPVVTMGCGNLGIRTMSTPDLHLKTMYQLDGDGHIVGTREPTPRPGPLFTLVRGNTSSAWAVRADLPPDVASGLESLAREEPPISAFQQPPAHVERYASLVNGIVESRQAFTFPENLPQTVGTVFIEDISLLNEHFLGWNKAEIAGLEPIVGVVEDGSAVSVCFCARRTEEAAEAELETASAFRGRGLAPQVTASWAQAIRASGQIPLYSTSLSNHASLAVARKLRLTPYAHKWSIFEGQ